MKAKIMITIMLFCILCSGCGSSKKKDSTISEQGHSMNQINTENVSESFQVTTVEGEFVYDTTNKYETVGFYNCVFAGTVSNIDGVIFPFEESYLAEDGEEVVLSGPMFTKMLISVTEVIKGNLEIGNQVETYKLGGYSDTENCYYLLDKDVYPEIGKEYLFLGNIDENGILWISAPETAIPLESNSSAISTYSESGQTEDRQSIMDTYTDAYQNEIPYSGEIFENSDFPEAKPIK